MPNINKSVYTTYFTDSEGNITGIKQNEEQNKISPLNFSVQLQYIPEEFNRVVVIDKSSGDVFHEINDITLLERGCFYVDYNTGRVTFSSEDAEKVALFSYYGLGYELLSCRRLYDQTALETDNVITTLQDIIDAGRSGIEYLNTIGNAVTIINNLKEQITKGDTCRSSLTTTIQTGTTLRNNLDNSIASANTSRTSLVNATSNANSTRTELTETTTNANNSKSELDDSISEANTARNNLNSSISTGNTLKNNLDTLTTTGETLKDELNTAITNGDISTVQTNITKLFGYTKVVTTFAELLSAVNLTAGVSGTIKIKGGTYIPTSTLLLRSRTRIEPLGDGEVIFDCSSSSAANRVFGTYLGGSETGYNGRHDISINGITFQGNGTSNTITCIGVGHGNRIEISNCKFTGFNNWHNIEINGCSNVDIHHCDFSKYGATTGGNPTEVIQLDFMGSSDQYPWTAQMDDTACKNINIYNCTFDNIQGTCIGTHTYKVNVVPENIRINNCYATNCITFCGLDEFKALTLKENICDSVRTFMRFETHYNVSIYLKVLDNKYIGTKNSEANSTIEGRFIHGVSTSIACQYINIANNTIEQANTHGIGMTAHYVTITGNYIRNNGKNGIYAYGGSKWVISGNNFADNNGWNEGFYDWKVGGNSSVNNWRVLLSGCNFTTGLADAVGCTSCAIIGGIGNVVNNAGSNFEVQMVYNI